MNHQQKLEAVRQACIKANPEIVELKFGCDVEIVIGSVACPATIVQKNYAGNWLVLIAGQTATYKDKQIYKIIGRPIRLADVLLALNWKWIAITSTGSFMVGSAESSLRWDLLADDLTKQSPEMVDLLYGLLK